MPFTEPARPFDPAQRARINNINNACNVAQSMTETTGQATVIVTTHDPFQPYRIYFTANCPPDAHVYAEYRAA
jgi:hypothetical protein